jgi:hypothetical protein
VPAVKSLLVRARLGLVHAIDARDAACGEIREDIALSHGRGVRASSRARRHLRDCSACREYRTALRATRNGFGALVPAHSNVGLLAKLLGIGGGGAAAGSGAAAGGGAIVVGSGVTATAAKVAAIVCCAAVVGTGAEVVHEQIAPPAKNPVAVKPAQAPAPAVRTHAAPATNAAYAGTRVRPRHPSPTSGKRHADAGTLPAAERTGALQGAVSAIPTPVTVEELASGGALAPEDVVEAVAPAVTEPSDAGGIPAPAETDAHSPTSGSNGPTATPAAAPPAAGSTAPAPPATGQAGSGGAAAPSAD